MAGLPMKVAYPSRPERTCTTLYEFHNLIAAVGVDFSEPDVSSFGGITIWMKVAHLAEANKLPVTSHGYRLEQFIAPPMSLTETGHAVTPGAPRPWPRIRLAGAGGIPGLI